MKRAVSVIRRSSSGPNLSIRAHRPRQLFGLVRGLQRGEAGEHGERDPARLSHGVPPLAVYQPRPSRPGGA